MGEWRYSSTNSQTWRQTEATNEVVRIKQLCDAINYLMLAQSPKYGLNKTLLACCGENVGILPASSAECGTEANKTPWKMYDML
jgi:hypothetical protein